MERFNLGAAWEAVKTVGKVALPLVTLAGCAEETYPPHGGGYHRPDSHETTPDETDEIEEWKDLTGEECRAFVEVAEDNPRSDVTLNPIDGSLDSAWVDTDEGTVLSYEQLFELQGDEIEEDLARSAYGCTAWDVENERIYSELTEALRDGSFLTVSANSTPDVADQATGITVWVLVDNESGNNDLRIAQAGALDRLSYSVDQDDAVNPINE